MTARIRTAILVSGRGSNMASLIEAAQASDYPAAITLVLSNNPAAPALQRAATAGVRADCIDHRKMRDRETFEQALDQHLRRAGIELVALAGFMRVLTPWFVERWHGRLINIHPSLLPSFPGLDTHARALAAGVTLHGCTVHHVTSELDSGPIVAQAVVPVQPDDDPQTLGARVLRAELKVYPPALAQVASLLSSDGRTALLRAADADIILMNPAPDPGHEG